MKQLYLDTTIAKMATVTIIEGRQILAKVTETAPLEAVEHALKKARLKLTDINSFSANPGPGSYTGIRVGLSIVNCLNWSFGKKVEREEPKYQ